MEAKMVYGISVRIFLIINCIINVGCDLYDAHFKQEILFEIESSYLAHLERYLEVKMDDLHQLER